MPMSTINEEETSLAVLSHSHTRKHTHAHQTQFVAGSNARHYKLNCARRASVIFQVQHEIKLDDKHLFIYLFYVRLER
jgi:hypothetical protein